MFCWESCGGGGGGLGKELPFLLPDTKSLPGSLFEGSGPQRGCTHRKVAGQELPVLLSKLLHQGPQLLILPKPGRQRAQLTHGQKAAALDRDPRSPQQREQLHSSIHVMKRSSNYAPGMAASELLNFWDLSLEGSRR